MKNLGRNQEHEEKSTENFFQRNKEIKSAPAQV